MALMMFLATFVQGFGRVLKDAMVLSHADAETLSAIKVWIVWPCSVLFILSYMKCSDLASRSSVYHGFNMFFIICFACFLWGYPYYDQLKLHFSHTLWAQQHSYLRYILTAIDEWPSSLFYMIAEMWTSIVAIVLTWEVANHITTLEQSRRFYSLYNMFRSLGIMTASFWAAQEASKNVSWEHTFTTSICLMLFAAMLLSIMLMVLCRLVGFDHLNEGTSRSVTKKERRKVPLIESVKRVLSSKTVLLITAMILCFGISINLMEGVWKKAVELFYHGQGNEIQSFIGHTNFLTASIGIILGVLATYFIQNAGWRVTALVTPICMFVTGLPFFIGMTSGGAVWHGWSAIKLAAYSGAGTVIIARAVKVSFFDTIKEMAYIPLEAELRSKGKAAADTIGERFGKGGGAVIQQLMLAVFSGATLIDLSPYLLGACLFIILPLWGFVVFYLDRTHGKIIDKIDDEINKIETNA